MLNFIVGFEFRVEILSKITMSDEGTNSNLGNDGINRIRVGKGIVTNHGRTMEYKMQDSTNSVNHLAVAI